MEWSILNFVFSMLAATVAGFCMGLERQLSGKAAGLKTYTLVAIGSFLFMYCALLFSGDEFVDTTRIIGQIVVGVGFLGAGVIMQ